MPLVFAVKSMQQGSARLPQDAQQKTDAAKEVQEAINKKVGLIKVDEKTKKEAISVVQENGAVFLYLNDHMGNRLNFPPIEAGKVDKVEETMDGRLVLYEKGKQTAEICKVSNFRDDKEEMYILTGKISGKTYEIAFHPEKYRNMRSFREQGTPDWRNIQ